MMCVMYDPSRNGTRMSQKHPAVGRVMCESLGTDSAFFDRFRPLDTLAQGKLCKKILPCTQRLSAPASHKNGRAQARYFFVGNVLLRTQRLQKILISSELFATCALRVRSCTARARNVAVSKTHAS
jgi:hypothetical protein